MPVPRYSIPTPGLRPSLGLILALFLAASPLFAASDPPRASDQPLRLPLEPLGFQPLSQQFLLAGSSMLTLHYVDDQHLLVTFNVRRLMHRMPDEPSDDMDRNVDALLLELPSGKILARTTWRFHDHGQYLWSLGHGRFLLRVRDTMTTIAPLLNLSTGEAFQEHPFLNSDQRRVVTLLLSPDQSMLVVETVKRTLPAERPKTPLFGPTPHEEPAPPSSVQINFYRLSIPSDTTPGITPRVAGVVRANGAGVIAATNAGYLAVIDQGRQHWAFDFNSWTGKTIELSPFDSTCRPTAYFVSRGEFIAYGCHGGSSRQVVGGFNMRGEEMWEQNLFGEYVSPSLVFAPSSGRFALGRVLVRSSTPDANDTVIADSVTGQTIVVYQTGSGRQILKADCSPVQRAGQNFALSPNGLGLAVVHADAIEVYTLPPPTSKEQADIKMAEDSAPPENDAPVHFATAQREPVPEQSNPAHTPSNTVQGSSTGSNDPSIFAVATSTGVSEETPRQSAAGDQPPEQPRKRPTLYTLPDDRPDAASDDQPK